MVGDADTLLLDVQRFLDTENKRWGSKGDQPPRIVGIHTKCEPVLNVSNCTWDAIVKNDCVMLEFVALGTAQSKQQVGPVAFLPVSHIGIIEPGREY